MRERVRVSERERKRAPPKLGVPTSSQRDPAPEMQSAKGFVFDHRSAFRMAARRGTRICWRALLAFPTESHSASALPVVNKCPLATVKHGRISCTDLAQMQAVAGGHVHTQHFGNFQWRLRDKQREDLSAPWEPVGPLVFQSRHPLSSLLQSVIIFCVFQLRFIS